MLVIVERHSPSLRRRLEVLLASAIAKIKDISIIAFSDVLAQLGQKIA
jgi:hypothetical protein